MDTTYNCETCAFGCNKHLNFLNHQHNAHKIILNKFYGQKGEDKYLYNTFFKNVKNKNYIELGAMDGINSSNTKFFEDTLGWTGVLIEPNETLYNFLKKSRPNNKLYNSLISNEVKYLDFKYFEKLGVSCIVDTMPENHNNLYFNSKRPQFYNHKKGLKSIKTCRLENILESSTISEFEFLSLDVEGHEFNVLKSINYDKVNIHILLIEMLEDNKDFKNIQEFLFKKNYIYHSDIGRNKVYVLKSSHYNK